MATATIATLFALFLVLVFSSERVSGECKLSSITVTQSETGGAVDGQPEYRVLVSNDCICSQSDLLLSCDSFSSTLAVDPAILRVVDGGRCLLNNGMPLFQGNDIVFNYASNTKFSFAPVGSQINCS